MNRRELFKGTLTALAAAAIPIPPELEAYGCSPVMDALPDAKWIQHFTRLREHLIDRINNPPVLVDGNIIRPITNDAEFEALRYVNKLLEKWDGPTQKI